MGNAGLAFSKYNIMSNIYIYISGIIFSNYYEQSRRKVEVYIQIRVFQPPEQIELRYKCDMVLYKCSKISLQELSKKKELVSTQHYLILFQQFYYNMQCINIATLEDYSQFLSQRKLYLRTLRALAQMAHLPYHSRYNHA